MTLPKLVWPVSNAPSQLIWLQRAAAPSHAHKHAPCEPGGASCIPKNVCAPQTLPLLHLLLLTPPNPPCYTHGCPELAVQGDVVGRTHWIMAMVAVGIPGDSLQHREGGQDVALLWGLHPPGPLAVLKILGSPSEPRDPSLGGEASVFHAKSRRGDWLGEVRGGPERPTPAVDAGAHPHPAAPRGAPARPRMLQDNGPPGPPSQVRAGHSRGHHRHCPHGPWGEPASLALPRTLSPSTGQGAAGGLGLQHVGLVASQQRPALARRLFPPSFPPCASVSPEWLLARVRGVRAARSHGGHSPPQHRWPRRARPAPGPGRGDGHSVLLGGWERTRLSREPGLPGNVALSPRRGVTEVPPGWVGGVSGCFRAPGLGLFHPVSFQLCSDSLGNPSILLQKLTLC